MLSLTCCCPAGCRRSLSQRVAVYSKKVSSEGDALAEDVAALCKRVDKAMHEAERRLDQEAPDGRGGDAERWADVLKELESARGIIHGTGTGGDL